MTSRTGTPFSDFSIGVFGREAFSIYIDHSNISLNTYNVAMSEGTTNWRLRDSVMNQAGAWSVRIAPPSNDHLISGVRFEGSGQGALLLGSYGTMLMNNRFESNGGFGDGILVTSLAQQTRILANLFSSDSVVDQGEGTECAFNIGLDNGC